MGLHFKENEEKITTSMIITVGIVITILLIFLIAFLVNASKSNIKDSDIKTDKIGDVETNDNEYEAVSIEMGKKVIDSKNNTIQNSTTEEEKNDTNTDNIASTSNSTQINSNSINSENINKENTKTNINLENQKKVSSQINNTKEEVDIQEENTKKEMKFIAPIKGEIIRKFAPDSLVYSKTLEEWVTHSGVDIKADKTTVIACAADGKVIAIKNDPRYGITVIVEHEDGYKTIYANLLTSEFVVEGEKIQEGQTIGTVGNTASFEITDDYHLHFEMLKDGEYINPQNYITFE